MTVSGKGKMNELGLVLLQLLSPYPAPSGRVAESIQAVDYHCQVPWKNCVLRDWKGGPCIGAPSK